MGSLYLNETVDKLSKHLNYKDPNLTYGLINFLLYKDSNFIKLNVRKKFLKNLLEIKHYDIFKLQKLKNELLQNLVSVEKDLKYYKNISPIKFVIIKNIRRELIYEINLINKIIHKEMNYKEEEIIKTYNGLNSLYDTIQNNFKIEDTDTLNKKLLIASKLFSNKPIFHLIKKQINLNKKANDIKEKIDGTFLINNENRIKKLMKEIEDSNFKLKKCSIQNKILKETIDKHESNDIKKFKDNMHNCQEKFDIEKNNQIEMLKNEIRELKIQLNKNELLESETRNQNSSQNISIEEKIDPDLQKEDNFENQNLDKDLQIEEESNKNLQIEENINNDSPMDKILEDRNLENKISGTNEVLNLNKEELLENSNNQVDSFSDEEISENSSPQVNSLSENDRNFEKISFNELNFKHGIGKNKELNDLKQSIDKLLRINIDTNLSIKDGINLMKNFKHEIKNLLDDYSSIGVKNKNYELLNNLLNKLKKESEIINLIDNTNSDNFSKSIKELNEKLESAKTISLEEIDKLNDFYKKLGNENIELNDFGKYKINFSSNEFKDDTEMQRILNENKTLKEILNETLIKLNYNPNLKDNLASLLGNEDYMKSLFDDPMKKFYVLNENKILDPFSNPFVRPSEFYSSNLLKNRFDIPDPKQPLQPNDIALRVFKENYLLNKKLLSERERIKNEQIDKIKKNYERIIDNLMSDKNSGDLKLLYELRNLDHNDPNIDKVLEKISKDQTERLNTIFDSHKYRLRDMAKMYTERMNYMQKMLEKNYQDNLMTKIKTALAKQYEILSKMHSAEKIALIKNDPNKDRLKTILMDFENEKRNLIQQFYDVIYFMTKITSYDTKKIVQDQVNKQLVDYFNNIKSNYEDHIKRTNMASAEKLSKLTRLFQEGYKGEGYDWNEKNYENYVTELINANKTLQQQMMDINYQNNLIQKNLFNNSLKNLHNSLQMPFDIYNISTTKIKNNLMDHILSRYNNPFLLPNSGIDNLLNYGINKGCAGNNLIQPISLNINDIGLQRLNTPIMHLPLNYTNDLSVIGKDMFSQLISPRLYNNYYYIPENIIHALLLDQNKETNILNMLQTYPNVPFSNLNYSNAHYDVMMNLLLNQFLNNKKESNITISQDILTDLFNYIQGNKLQNDNNWFKIRNIAEIYNLKPIKKDSNILEINGKQLTEFIKDVKERTPKFELSSKEHDQMMKVYFELENKLSKSQESFYKMLQEARIHAQANNDEEYLNDIDRIMKQILDEENTNQLRNLNVLVNETNYMTQNEMQNLSQETMKRLLDQKRKKLKEDLIRTFLSESPENKLQRIREVLNEYLRTQARSNATQTDNERSISIQTDNISQPSATQTQQESLILVPPGSHIYDPNSRSYIPPPGGVSNTFSGNVYPNPSGNLNYLPNPPPPFGGVGPSNTFSGNVYSNPPGNLNYSSNLNPNPSRIVNFLPNLPNPQLNLETGFPFKQNMSKEDKFIENISRIINDQNLPMEDKEINFKNELQILKNQIEIDKAISNDKFKSFADDLTLKFDNLQIKLDDKPITYPEFEAIFNSYYLMNNKKSFLQNLKSFYKGDNMHILYKQIYPLNKSGLQLIFNNMKLNEIPIDKFPEFLSVFNYLKTKYLLMNNLPNEDKKMVFLFDIPIDKNFTNSLELINKLKNKINILSPDDNKEIKYIISKVDLYNNSLSEFLNRLKDDEKAKNFISKINLKDEDHYNNIESLVKLEELHQNAIEILKNDLLNKIEKHPEKKEAFENIFKELTNKYNNDFKNYKNEYLENMANIQTFKDSINILKPYSKNLLYQREPTPENYSPDQNPFLNQYLNAFNKETNLINQMETKYTNEINNLKRQNEELNNELRNVILNKPNESNYSKLMDVVNNHEQKINNLQSVKSDMENKLVNLKNEIKKYENILSNPQINYDEIENKLFQRNDELNKHFHSFFGNNENKNSIDLLLNKLHNAEITIEELHSNFKPTNYQEMKINDLYSEKKDLEQELQKLRNKLDETPSKYDIELFRDEMNNKNNEIKRLSTTIDTLNKDILNLTINKPDDSIVKSLRENILYSNQRENELIKKINNLEIELSKYINLHEGSQSNYSELIRTKSELERVKFELDKLQNEMRIKESFGGSSLNLNEINNLKYQLQLKTDELEDLYRKKKLYDTSDTELQNKYNQLQAQKENIQMLYDRLIDENKNLNNKLLDYQNQIGFINQEKNKLINDERELTSDREIINNLKLQNEKNRNEYNILKQQLEELNKEHRDTLAKNDHYVILNEGYKYAIEELEKNEKEYHELIRKYNLSIKDENPNRELIEKLESEFENNRKQMENLKQKEKNIIMEENELRKKLNDPDSLKLKEKYDKLIDQFEENQKELDQIRKQKMNVQKSLLESEILKLQEKLKYSEEQLKNYRKGGLEENKDKLLQELEDAHNKIKELEDSKTSFNEEITFLNDERKQLFNLLDDYKQKLSKCEELEKNYKDLKEKYNMLSNDPNSPVEDVTELKRKLKEAEDEMEKINLFDIKLNYDNTLKELADAKNKIKLLEDGKTSFEESSKNIIENKDDLLKKIKENELTITRYKEMEEEFEKMKIEYDLLLKNKNANTSLEDYQKEKDKILNEIEQLKKNDSGNPKINNLEIYSKSLDSRNSEYKIKILEEQIEELKRKHADAISEIEKSALNDDKYSKLMKEYNELLNKYNNLANKDDIKELITKKDKYDVLETKYLNNLSALDKLSKEKVNLLEELNKKKQEFDSSPLFTEKEKLDCTNQIKSALESKENILAMYTRELNDAKMKNNDLSLQIQQLNAEIAILNTKDLGEATRSCFDEMNKMKEQRKNEILNINKSHAEDIEKLNLEFKRKETDLRDSFKALIENKTNPIAINEQIQKLENEKRVRESEIENLLKEKENEILKIKSESNNDVLRYKAELDQYKNKLMTEEQKNTNLLKDLKKTEEELLKTQVNIEPQSRNEMIELIVEENVKLKNQIKIDEINNNSLTKSKDDEISSLEQKLIYCNKTTQEQKELLKKQEEELRKCMSEKSSSLSLNSKIIKLESDLKICKEINKASNNLDPSLKKIEEIQETLTEEINKKNEIIKRYETQINSLTNKLTILEKNSDTMELEKSNKECLKQVKRFEEEYILLQEENRALNDKAQKYDNYMNEKLIEERLKQKERQRLLDEAERLRRKEAENAKETEEIPTSFADKCLQLKEEYLLNIAVLSSKFKKFQIMLNRINKQSENKIKNLNVKNQFKDFMKDRHLEFTKNIPKYEKLVQMESNFKELNCAEKNDTFLSEYYKDKKIIETLEEDPEFKDLYTNLLGIGKKILRIKPDFDPKKTQILFPIEGTIPQQENVPRCLMNPVTSVKYDTQSMTNKVQMIYSGFTNIYYDFSNLPNYTKQDTTNDIFNCEIKGLIDNLNYGNDLLFFVYGQSGSGKTYTLLGNDKGAKGILGYSIDYMLTQPKKFRDISVTIFQLYPDAKGSMDIYFILQEGDIGSNTPVITKQKKKEKSDTSSFSKNTGIGKSMKFITFKTYDISGKTPSVPLAEFDQLKGDNYGDKIQRFLTERRFQRATTFNDDSSRSHAFVILNVKVDVENKKTKSITEEKVKILFIDLGGNEKVREVAPKGSAPFVEGIFITQTLNDLISVVLQEFIAGKALEAKTTQQDFCNLMKYYLAIDKEKINKIVLFIHAYGFIDESLLPEIRQSYLTTTTTTLDFFNKINNLDNMV